jgi:hypothetical protein
MCRPGVGFRQCAAPVAGASDEQPRGRTGPAAIEETFPYREVNRLAATESYNKHHYRPTNYQHKWWARRLGSVFRSLCLAALAEPGTSATALWERFAEPNDVGDAVVFDPFMGGGTTGHEATRLGAKFVAADLNPVAWCVARMALAPQPPDLDPHFEAVLAAAREEIRPYHRTRCPDCGEETGAQFYRWVELDGEELVSTRQATHRIQAVTDELNDRTFPG